ncbi:MAG: hypothetical protein ACRC9R_04025 [Enterovibrio sp.]
MLPNQPLPTTAEAGTSATTTQTVAATQGDTSTEVAQAIVTVVNAAEQPQTHDTQGALRTRPSTVAQLLQTRVHPYQRPLHAPRPAADAAPAALAAPPAPPVQGNALGTYPLLLVRRDQETYPLDQMQGFFRALSERVGLVWDQTYIGVSGENTGNVGRGAIRPSSLSFSQRGIESCQNPEIRELLLRVNEAREPERRRALLVRAIRAFSETAAFWSGMLGGFCFLLGVNIIALSSWLTTLPSVPTAANRVAGRPLSETAMSEPLSLKLPMDVLSLPEMLRFLQSHLATLQGMPQPFYQIATDDESAGAAASRELLMRITFDDAVINSSPSLIARQMKDFNKSAVLEERGKFLARIVCVLRDMFELPAGIFSRVCELLGTTTHSVSSWYRHNRARGNAPPSARAVRQGRPRVIPVAATSTVTTATVSQSRQAAPVAARPLAQQGVATTSTATAPSALPAATQQAPQLLPAAATAAAVAQGKKPAAPVFTAPAIPSTSTAAALAPIVPPFFDQAEGEKEDEEEKMEQGAEGTLGQLPIPSQESEEAFREMLLYENDIAELASMDSDELYFFLERDGNELDDLEEQQERRELLERQAAQARRLEPERQTGPEPQAKPKSPKEGGR